MRKNIKNFVETENQTSCNSTGYCALNPTIEIIEELFLNEIRQISYYITKFSNSEIYDDAILSQLITSLAEDVFATQPHESDVLDKLRGLVSLRNSVKKQYEDFCKNSMQGCETVNFIFEPDLTWSYVSCIENAAKYIYVRNKTFTLQQLRYFELITLLSKVASQTIFKIKAYEPEFSSYDFKLLKFFSATALFYETPAKIKKKIMQFAQDIYEIRKYYLNLLTKYYGKRISANIRTSLLAGKSLLVAGSNLKELEDILNACADTDINVYTNGELYIAHTYEKFAKYKNLKGHISSGLTNYDFSNFEGVVFVTKFMSHKIDQLYQGIIFTSSDIISKGMLKVKDNNFSDIFEAIAKHNEAKAKTPQTFESIELAQNNVDELFSESKNQVAVFIGKTKSSDLVDEIDNKKIINIEYQSDSDLFYKVVEKSRETKIPLVLFSSRCSPRVIADIVSILNEKTVQEVYMVKCQTSSVNPHVVECLRDEFGVKIIE
ncbi:hypothetical protein IKA15_04715 [bacterium]|nr:hypothetical protein [bacterium]